ncbi:MAG: hypothetical protein KUG81_03415 [Gammaproteobacteria bacterium]|nr:hypothetical protein [Gammaproteobacteria bacterium]
MIQINSNFSPKAISLKISDNGRGISNVNRDKIFTPFFTTRRQDSGTGLGLGIIQSLFQAHDGDIKIVDSNAGACFEVNLHIMPCKKL